MLPVVIVMLMAVASMCALMSNDTRGQEATNREARAIERTIQTVGWTIH